MTGTNLITGFLGSGKTTSILHLLAHKDPNENGRYWLMNLGKSELMVLCSPIAAHC